MRTLPLLIKDWHARAWLLYAQGPRRLTNTRRLLNGTCLLAMAWILLVALHAERVVTHPLSLVLGIAFVTLATMIIYASYHSWRMTRLRAVSGLGWALLLLLSVEIICIGIAMRQWPWVIACAPSAVVGAYGLNHAIDKLQQSLWRVKNPV